MTSHQPCPPNRRVASEPCAPAPARPISLTQTARDTAPTAPDRATALELGAWSHTTPAGPILGVALVALVAYLDVVTGAELSVSIFYVAPIAFVSWRFGRRWGWAVALLSASAWYGADRYGGQHYSHSLIPIWNALVRLGFFVGAVEALHRLRAALIVAQDLARSDALTGLANSRAFREATTRGVAYARRYGGQLSVVYIDIDNFKQVNDRLGHAAGDRVLTSVGRLLKENLRQSDTPARLGGDEFAILLPQADAASARAAMQKLQKRLALLATASGWPISLSIGIVTFKTPPPNVDALIAAADHMMYDAKQAGKDRILQRECD